jgi:nucleotidyltransferase substrate binding protein (TIGR01987 family)
MKKFDRDMEGLDVPWRQRLNHFLKAFRQLERAVELAKQRPLSEIEQQGIIKIFENAHEVACDVLKDYFAYQGNTSIMGSRDATREAFQKGLITDGEGWMEMIRSRNLSSHTYNEEIADEIAAAITGTYFPLFQKLSSTMESLSHDR